MKFIVTIPTYERPLILAKRSLTTLQRGGISSKDIVIFVADKAQKDLYFCALDFDSYAEIIIAEKGIAPARNFISRHFSAGQALLQMDDDVLGIFEAKNEKDLAEVTDLAGFFSSCFDRCVAEGARLWGFYPMLNPFYMKGTEVTTTLRPVIGVTHGIINEPSFQLTRRAKEDLERTLLFFEKDGKVVRFNRFASKQTARTLPGGLQTPGGRDAASEQADVDYLCQRFPQWCTPAKPKKGGFAEVRLKA